MKRKKGKKRQDIGGDKEGRKGKSRAETPRRAGRVTLLRAGAPAAFPATGLRSAPSLLSPFPLLSSPPLSPLPSLSLPCSPPPAAPSRRRPPPLPPRSAARPRLRLRLRLRLRGVCAGFARGPCCSRGDLREAAGARPRDPLLPISPPGAESRGAPSAAGGLMGKGEGALLRLRAGEGG